MNISWVKPKPTNIGRKYNLALSRNVIGQSMCIPLSHWFSVYVPKMRYVS